MSLSYILGQVLGIVAFAIGVTVFLQKTDRKLKYRLATYTLFMAGHFFLLGAVPAGVSALLNSTRTIVSIHFRRVIIMYIFMALTLLLAVPHMSHWMEVLPIVGTFMSTFAFFKLSTLNMRYAMWMSTLCWTIYNVWVGSIGGSAIEATFLVMNGITTYRLRKLVLEGKNPFG